jgi:hypothetical protein
MPYIGKDPGTGLRGRFIYTATAGQTSFTGADSLGRTLTYTDSEYTDVYLNGVKLDKTDYTATSGTSIVLDSGASAGDILEILAFDTFGLFSGEFAQDVTVAGALTVSGTTTTAATTMTGDLSLADKIVHTGDTNTAIRFPAADTVTVETGGTEALRIDSSQNVGIGDTSPDSTLHVNSGASNTAVTLESTDASVWQVMKDDTASLFFGNTGGNFALYTSDTERIRVLSGGGLTFNGDTAAANALDDYEEGTWTPVFQATSANPTISYNVQVARYVKVGTLVCAEFRIQVGSVSGGSGSLLVGGFPFVHYNTTNFYASGVVGYSATFETVGGEDPHPQVLHMANNSTTAVLITNGTADSRSALSTAFTPDNLKASSDVIASMTYITQ